MGIPIAQRKLQAIRDYTGALSVMHVLATKSLIKESICEIFNCGYGNGYSQRRNKHYE